MALSTSSAGMRSPDCPFSFSQFALLLFLEEASCPSVQGALSLLLDWETITELRCHTAGRPAAKELMGSFTFPAPTPATSEDAVVSAPTFCEEPLPRQGLEPRRLLRGHPQTYSFPCLATFPFLSLESRKQIAPRQTHPARSPEGWVQLPSSCGCREPAAPSHPWDVNPTGLLQVRQAESKPARELVGPCLCSGRARGGVQRYLKSSHGVRSPGSWQISSPLRGFQLISGLKSCNILQRGSAFALVPPQGEWREAGPWYQPGRVGAGGPPAAWTLCGAAPSRSISTVPAGGRSR